MNSIERAKAAVLPHIAPDAPPVQVINLTALIASVAREIDKGIPYVVSPSKSSLPELLTQFNINRDFGSLERNRAESTLRAIFNHWNEFGPEHGFGELMDRAQAGRVSATQQWGDC